MKNKATYSESVETVVGGGPQVEPIGPAPPPPADSLRAPSQLKNVIDEAIEDKQRAMPQGSGLTASTHLAIADRTISCTLVAGTHIVIDGENINHDDVGPKADTLDDTMECPMSSGGWQITLEVDRDAEGHVVDVRLNYGAA